MPKETLTEETSQQLRKLHAELNILSSADGSAILCQGNTVVTASVYGPIEGKHIKSLVERAYVELAYKSKGGPPGIFDKMNETIIKNTCEAAILSAMYPRTAISIAVQEMQNDGSLLACAVNACCLALLNAGIPLKYLFVAVTCVIDKNDQIHLDSTTGDENASLTFVFDSLKKNVITSHTIGNFSDELYLEAMFKCQSACDEIIRFERHLVEQYALKLGKRRG